MTDEKQSPPAEDQGEKPNYNEYLDKVKDALGKLPKWERFSFFAGIAYLISLYTFNIIKVTSTVTYEGSLGGRSSYKFSTAGGFWFTLSLIAAIVVILLPFLETFLPKFKLPVPKSLIYFVAGVSAAVGPGAKYLFLESKTQSYWGVTIKQVPDLGWFILLALAGVMIFSGTQMGGHKLVQEQIQKAQKTIKEKQAAAKDDTAEE